MSIAYYPSEKTGVTSSVVASSAASGAGVNFAALLKSHTTSTTTGTLLDATADQDRQRDERADDRAATRAELRRDTTPAKALDRTEIRQEGLADDYEHRLERRELARDVATRREPVAVPDVPRASSAAPPAMPLTTLVPSQATALATVQTMPATPDAALAASQGTPQTQLVPAQAMTQATPQTAPVVMATNGVAMPTVPTTAREAIPVSVLSSASVLTIFSASGKLAGRDEVKEKEERDGIANKRKKEKKDGELAASEPASVASVEFRRPERPVLESSPSDTPVDTEVRPVAADANPEKEPEQEPDRQPEPPAPDELLDARPTISFEEFLRNAPIVVPSLPETTAEEQLERIRYLRQLSRRVATACRSATGRSGAVRIKVNLDRLGSVAIRVAAKDDAMDIRLEATTEEAVRLLLEGLDDLKSDLDEQGIRVAAFAAEFTPDR